MLHKAFFSILLIGLLFSACMNTDKYNEKVKQLDSLSLLIDSAEIKFSSIDTSKIKNYSIEISQNLRLFEKSNTNTITNETTILLAEYGRCLKCFEEINSEYSKLKNELTESKEQLENLIHDLKMDKVEETKAAGFIQEELIASSNSYQLIMAVENFYKVNLTKFEALNPKILVLIKKSILK